MGGIQKWTFDGSNWTLAYTISVGAGAGARHLFTTESSGLVTVVATTTTVPDAIVRVVDGGPGSTAITLATAEGKDTAFRGVAQTPMP